MDFTAIGISQLVLILLFAFVLPAFHVLTSRRSHGGAKVGWLIAVLMFSVLAYAVFLVVTQHELDRNPHNLNDDMY